MVRPSDEWESDDEDLLGEVHSEDKGIKEANSVARVPTRAKKSKPIRPDLDDQVVKGPSRELNGSRHGAADLLPQSPAELEKLRIAIENLTQRIDKLEEANDAIITNNQRTSPRVTYKPRNRDIQQPQFPTPPPNQIRNYQVSMECFRCGQEGHIARNCPTSPWMTGHMQLAVQPMADATQPTTNQNRYQGRAPQRNMPQRTTNSGSQKQTN
jgi:hypothetical protein